MAGQQRVYLDYNASAPLRPEAAEAVLRALRLPGNASSVHLEGRAARAELETARDAVAALAGVAPKSVVFTSGGTEANNLALCPTLGRKGHGAEGHGAMSMLLVGATEHPSVLAGHRYPPHAVEQIPVDGDGLVDLDWLGERLSTAGPALVSVQAANNETGVVQPVAAVGDLVRGAGGLLHVDAVQAAGKLPLGEFVQGADVLTLSAHKLGGPKGIGAMILASDRVEIGVRLIRGGGQERGFRAGTENVAAAAGFGVAAAWAVQCTRDEAERVERLKCRAESGLLAVAPDAVVFGAGTRRLPNTFAFAIPGLRAETALIAFDLEGIALSSGSACSSGKVRPSHVLAAMGVEPDLAQGALRVSLGWMTTEEDVSRFLGTCERVASNLYRRRASAA
jgi:cysteine desulfurase